MTLDYKAVLAGGVVLLVVYFVAKREAGQALKTVGHAINPTNNDNVIYSGVNAVGEAVSGEKGWSLGSWLYDVTHKGQ